MLRLIPINEQVNSKNKSSISKNELEYLAFLATTLSPVDSFSIIEGYTSSLWEYMQELKYENKELFIKYDKLIHAENGSAILKALIELLLIEKDIRNMGINENVTTKYNIKRIEYLRLMNDLEE